MSAVLDFIGITALTVLSAASVIWYFRERRKMLVFVRDYVKELEEFFKPRDKTYTLLGYLVGFRAVYKLRGGDELYVLLTTAPRYALLYLPFIKVLGREHLVTYFYKSGKPRRLRTYIAVRQSAKRTLVVVESDIQRLGLKLERTAVETPTGRYVVFHEPGAPPYLISDILQKTSLDVRKLAVYGSLNSVEVTVPPRLGEVGKVWDLLKTALEMSSVQA
jgi:hypothetical protein